MKTSLRVAGWGTLGFALTFFVTFTINAVINMTTVSPDYPTAAQMAADFGSGVLFVLTWSSAGIALGVAAHGLSAVVWPDGGLVARISAGFGVIATTGWLLSGVTVLAQRTALLNGNITGAGADAAAERAVVELGFIGVHIGGILFSVALVPWLVIVAVGAARSRRIPVTAIVFLWVAAIAPLAGFVTTGFQYGVLVVMLSFAVVGPVLLRHAARSARADVVARELEATRAATPTAAG